MAICLGALYHTILSIARGKIKKIFTRLGEEFLGGWALLGAFKETHISEMSISELRVFY